MNSIPEARGTSLKGETGLLPTSDAPRRLADQGPTGAASGPLRTLVGVLYAATQPSKSAVEASCSIQFA